MYFHNLSLESVSGGILYGNNHCAIFSLSPHIRQVLLYYLCLFPMDITSPYHYPLSLQNNTKGYYHRRAIQKATIRFYCVLVCWLVEGQTEGQFLVYMRCYTRLICCHVLDVVKYQTFLKF